MPLTRMNARIPGTAPTRLCYACLTILATKRPLDPETFGSNRTACAMLAGLKPAILFSKRVQIAVVWASMKTPTLEVSGIKCRSQLRRGCYLQGRERLAGIGARDALGSVSSSHCMRQPVVRECDGNGQNQKGRVVGHRGKGRVELQDSAGLGARKSTHEKQGGPDERQGKKA